MIIFKDGDDNTTSKVAKGTAIKFHNRILINPELFLKEWDKVYLFTDENVEEFQKYYNNKLSTVLQDRIHDLEGTS
ncbi:hypothetical protein BK007_02080 [Methanobacterium subterraneum]|uniref:Uncharacterized protein n=1 Tax=Methanobacterium subterraneum TaxID=59277 RepID=A0A2H4VA04_9EURY|nr:hypothetical protein [Methanobacterium subterraneum]AUB54926.1 hypothetical protein BK007_02080 [Methanobacterium subterraneum]